MCLLHVYLLSCSRTNSCLVSMPLLCLFLATAHVVVSTGINCHRNGKWVIRDNYHIHWVMNTHSAAHPNACERLPRLCHHTRQLTSTMCVLVENTGDEQGDRYGRKVAADDAGMHVWALRRLLRRARMLQGTAAMGFGPGWCKAGFDSLPQVSRVPFLRFCRNPTCCLYSTTPKPGVEFPCRRAGSSQEDNSPGWPCTVGWRAATEDGSTAKRARTTKKKEQVWPSSKIKSWVYHSLMLWHSLNLGINLTSVSALLLSFWRH